MQSWQVQKFGGTSLANAQRYRGAAEILRSDPAPRVAVVVSAMGGVTNRLIELVELARQRNNNYLAQLESLKQKHLDTLTDLLSGASQPDLVAGLSADFTDIKEILRGVWLCRNCTELTVELISGYGEVWSAQFLNAYLLSTGAQSTWLDARQVLVVEPLPTSVVIDWEASQARLDQWLTARHESIVVITGFIASTREGMATTLKRNGSDYSAAIFGALFKASSIVIWTDVDGVLSADPRLVPEAVVVEEMSYHEATELAYFGAKVLHPSTMGPAIRNRIPIWIKNTFNPSAPGTRISEKSRSDAPVKGFSTIDNMALVNVEGTGMIGVPGVAQRLFGALREVGVSVVMISQASSEHSICFVIPEAQASLAQSTLETAFYSEIHHGHIQMIGIMRGCTILAIVGDNMVEQRGIAAKFFGALGKADVNVRAIAQGSSERNISAVIESSEATRGLRAVHAAFYLSHHTISVGVIGPGLIGATFLDQLQSQIVRLKRDFNLDIRVRGIMNSRKMLLGEPQIEMESWRELMEQNHLAPSEEAFIRHIHAEHLPHAVIVDASASDALPSRYQSWLAAGLHIITPNKKANSGPMELYRTLQQTARSCNRHYLYETTVGAGLPVIGTLRDLVHTGDKIHKIEGVLSGTLSFLFNSFVAGTTFSAIVRDARDRGFTEPDPRDDLSGADVARKLVILGREIGLSLELADIRVENLVPEFLRGTNIDELMDRLPEMDAPMERRRAQAQAAGEVLRYVGVIECSTAGVTSSVELRAYPATHPLAGLTQTDNLVAFQSQRYQTQPLVVRGPGAGPEVTAAGVFADLLRLTSYLGGRN